MDKLKKFSSKELATKRNTAIRLSTYMFEKTNMVKNILESSKPENVLKDLEALLEKNKDAYGNEFLQDTINELKKLSPEASEKVMKDAIADILTGVEFEIGKYESYLKELNSVNFRGSLALIDDDKLEEFNKKHPETLFYMQTWFLATTGGVLLAAIAGTIFLVMRKKNQTKF